MLGIMDKKKVLTQILGADPRERKEEGASQNDALSLLAQELIDAVGNGDAKGAAQALRSCVLECQSAAQGSGQSSTEG